MNSLDAINHGLTDSTHFKRFMKNNSRMELKHMIEVFSVIKHHKHKDYIPIFLRGLENYPDRNHLIFMIFVDKDDVLKTWVMESFSRKKLIKILAKMPVKALGDAEKNFKSNSIKNLLIDVEKFKILEREKDNKLKEETRLKEENDRKRADDEFKNVMSKWATDFKVETGIEVGDIIESDEVKLDHSPINYNDIVEDDESDIATGIDIEDQTQMCSDELMNKKDIIHTNEEEGDDESEFMEKIEQFLETSSESDEFWNKGKMAMLKDTLDKNGLSDDIINVN